MVEIALDESTEFKVFQLLGDTENILIRVDSFEKNLLPRVPVDKEVCHIVKNIILIIKNCLLVHPERLHVVTVHTLP